VNPTPELDMVAEAEAMGLHLRLADGKVKASYPSELRPSVGPILGRLRANRERVAEVLRRRSEIPPMPPGVRLVEWKLEEPPVVLERWSVVNDVGLFARTTLDQLRAALAGKNWLAGNWSIRELVERLERVGVVVALEERPSLGPAETVPDKAS
jgi:hypothetical protein